MINLVVSDWGLYRQTRAQPILAKSFISNTEITPELLKLSYKAGVKLLYVDITECSSKKATVPAEIIHKLESCRFDFEEGWVDNKYNKDKSGNYIIDCDLYIDIFIFICMKGNPALSIEKVKMSNLIIGGPGLF